MERKTDIAAQVTRMFQDHLNIKVPGPDTDLVAQGMLDSLALVDLILRIEEDMGVVVDMETLEIEDFRTVHSISDYLIAARNGSAS
ncbi:MAG: acyl carrier protein [Planctomycetota bacterium]|nr:acyl carrier protein [Planctomycetota bacterium]